ncbi:MAG: methyltransferase domain-containing protein [Candidatus Geothermincolia bacterium]
MGEITFDGVAGEYGGKSLVQASAARKLLGLVELGPRESVLDVGCGPGHITRQLAGITGGRVVGTDISAGMIAEAARKYPGIEFRRVAAEDLDFEGEFDVVFCNSALQWFADGRCAVGRMYAALEPGGRLGLACPSTPDFAPWFNRIVETVSRRPEIAPTYAHRRSPWFHLPDLPAYRAFFEEIGFHTRHAELEHEVTEYTLEQAFGIYSTGAAQGFIGRDYYDVELTDEYLAAFSGAVRDEMVKRSVGGMVEVDFNRLYYIGNK